MRETQSKFKYFAAAVVLSLITQPSFAKSTADTEIPERREFPLSTTVGPCEDFYQYTCGPVVEQFELPDDRSRWTFSFSDSGERILRHKKKFLASLTGDRASQQPTERDQQYIHYYMSCMNTAARKSEESLQLKKLVREFNELAKRANNKKALLEWLGQNTVRGTGPRVVQFSDANNQKDSNQVDLLFYTDLRNLPDRNFYESPQVVKDYQALVENFFKAIGFSQPQARAQRLVDFEKRFAMVFPTEAEMRDVWTREDAGIAKAQALALYPALKLERILNAIPQGTFIRHLTPEVYEFTNRELSKISFEDLRDILLFAQLKDSLRFSTPEYYKRAEDFGIAHLGQPPQKPALEEECASDVSGHFDREVDTALFDEMFPNFPEQNFRGMVERVRQAMTEKLSSNQWLQPKTRDLALEKLNSIRMQVVKPMTEKDWDYVPLRAYSPAQYLKNKTVFAGAKAQATLGKIGRPADKDVWGMGPLTVNAYYNPPESKFVMPAGILQYPFFDVSGSIYENLGAVGMVVGHEVGHSFDDQGSKFDKFGNVNPWMSKEDLEKFAEISGRIDAQYIAACKSAVDNLDKLTVKDTSVVPPKSELYKVCEGDENGNNTYADLSRGENIGDIAGMQFAYEAAFPAGAGRVEDKQKFFLQYGKVWCGSMRTGAYIHRLRTDEHAQLPMRTNEPVKHLNGFYEAFNCKAGDPMYLAPQDRVNIW